MSGHSIVFEILKQAVSQDARILKPAEQKLATWETEPGFYAILKDVFCDHSLEENVRLIAILYFKNGVDKYWRPNAPNAISDDEKKVVRECLPYILKEPSRMIATHLSVLIARIARFDCPKHWPELIPELMKAIQSDYLPQFRALMILHEIIKSLSSKCLASDRKMFQDLSEFIYSDLFNLWNSSLDELFYCFQNKMHESESCKAITRALICLKILEKLTVRGFRNPEGELIDNFMKLVIDRAKILLQMRNEHPLMGLTTKYIGRSMKVLQRFLNTHIICFSKYVISVLEFIVIFTFTPEGEQYVYENFILQSFNLIKTIMSKHSELEVNLKKAVFTPEVLNAICRKMITHYLLFTPSEIEMWEQDPESFAVIESGDAWKFSLRPSVEDLFKTLFSEFRSTFVPIIQELMVQNAALVQPEDTHSILIKDAVYNVVGMVILELPDQVDFNSWLNTTLLKELSIEHQNYKILRKRILWLIGRRMGLFGSPESFPIVFATIINFLRSEEDMVVRLTAAHAVKNIIDVYDFNTNDFLNYLEPMFNSLFRLLIEAKECDTKVSVLHILYIVIERVDHHIELFHDKLVKYLPVLWEESQSHNMLRCAVVTTLAKLVKALRKFNSSVDVYTFLLSVIQISTDVNQPCYIYLLNDGLDLWLAVMEILPEPSDGILLLFKNMPVLLENNADTLKTCIAITSAYVLLAPNEFLQAYGERLVQVIKDIMTDLHPDGMILLANLVVLFLKVNSSASCHLIKPLLPKIFESVCDPQLYQKVFSVYMCILSRVLLVSKEIFIEAATEATSLMSESKDEALNKFIDTWLDRMPSIWEHKKKKIMALALSSLLLTDQTFIYNKFCGILLAVSEVLNDIVSYKDNTAIDETMFNYETVEENAKFETEHEYRKKLLASRDIVGSVNLVHYFQEQINLLKSSLSPSQFEQFIQTVDVETLAQVRLFVVL